LKSVSGSWFHKIEIGWIAKLYNPSLKTNGNEIFNQLTYQPFQQFSHATIQV